MTEEAPPKRPGLSPIDERADTGAAQPNDKISEVFGLLKRDDGPCLSIDEIKEITEQGWAGELPDISADVRSE